MRSTFRCSLIAWLLAAAVAAQCNLEVPPCPGSLPCSFFGCVDRPTGGCVPALAVAHASGVECTGGSFDLRGTQYETGCATLPGCLRPPPLRFWGYNQYANANSGCGWPGNDPGGWWMINLGTDLGVGTDGHWILYQSNWKSCAIDGCVTSNRTVAELSDVYPSLEGTPRHDSWYLVASVGFASVYDFDAITQADLGAYPGCGPASPRQAPVPGLAIAGANCPNNVNQTAATDNPTDADYLDVSVAVSTAIPDYFTNAGHNDPAIRLIAGLQVVYRAEATIPITSQRDAWIPARHPGNPATMVAGLITWGGPSTRTVSIPKSAGTVWLGTRIVYNDPINPTGPVLAANGPRVVSHVGRSCGPVGGPFVCDLARLGLPTDLRGVRRAGTDDAEFSWTGDPGAIEYHLNSVPRKQDLVPPGPHRSPPGVATLACDTAAPTTSCVHLGALGGPPAILYYRTVAACGPTGADEGPLD